MFTNWHTYGYNILELGTNNNKLQHSHDPHKQHSAPKQKHERNCQLPVESLTDEGVVNPG